MNVLRSALLTGAAIAFCGLAAAQLVPGGTPPAAPEPPPVPSPPAAAGGVVSTISFAEVKAIFEGAGVPFEVGQAKSGQPFLLGKPKGWPIFVMMMGCSDEAAQTGCIAVSVESGTYVKPATAQVTNVFNNLNIVSRAVVGNGTESYIRQIIVLNSGVSPTYVREAFARFTDEMAIYAEVLDQANGGGTPAPAGGAFSSGSALPDLTVKASREGRVAYDAELTGHAAGGAFGK